MTMTYKTIAGTITRPGSDIGIRARVTATPLTTNNALTFTDDNRISVGPEVVETNSAGVLPTFKIPTNVDVGELYWKITAERLDNVAGVPKKWTLKNAVQITGTGTVQLRDLAEVDTITVDSQIIVNISDLVVDAENARDDAEISELAAEEHKDAAAASATAASGSQSAAAGSASTASTAASTATTQAGIATTKAGEAASSATAAAGALSDVEDLVGAAEAVAVSNDTIIAGRINDDASATAAALSASIDEVGTGLFEKGRAVTIYVETDGDDGNSGLLRSNAKATVAGALTALGSNPGTIELGAGTFTISAADAYGNGVTLRQLGTILRGQGMTRTNIQITTPVTWGIKAELGYCTIEKLTVTFTASAAGSTYGIGASTATDPGSAQSPTFRNLNVIANAAAPLTACYAIGPDHPGSGDIDIALGRFEHCLFNGGGSTVNGFLLGNGTVGNVLLHSCWGSGGSGVQYGITLAGCGVSWFGGGFTGCSVADIRVTAVASDAITFVGLRGEDGAKALQVGYIGNGTAGITLIDHQARNYSASEIITFNAFAPLRLIGGYFDGGASTTFGINTSSGAHQILFVAREVATPSANPYPAKNTTYRSRIISGALQLSAGVLLPITGLQAINDLADPVELEFPTTSLSLGSTAVAQAIANYAMYRRSHGRGTISKIRIRVGTSSGNISVGAYSGTGTGLSRKPGAVIAKTAAMATPASGKVDISLGSTITVEKGDFLALSCDTTGASFYAEASGGLVTDGVDNGRNYYQSAAHPLPASATPLGGPGQLWIMDGVA